MGKIIFILGGVRSGKSAYAVELAKRQSKKVAFIATCLPLDKEMKKRVQIHKKNRPSLWKTFQEPDNILSLLSSKKIGSKFEVLVIDCITLFISNLFLNGLSPKAIENKIKNILNTLKSAKYKSIIVSNEVGLGVHPVTKLGRSFQDLAGRINQIIARESQEIFFMVSGLPLKVKGGKHAKNK